MLQIEKMEKGQYFGTYIYNRIFPALGAKGKMKKRHNRHGTNWVKWTTIGAAEQKFIRKFPFLSNYCEEKSEKCPRMLWEIAKHDDG